LYETQLKRIPYENFAIFIIDQFFNSKSIDSITPSDGIVQCNSTAKNLIFNRFKLMGSIHKKIKTSLLSFIFFLFVICPTAFSQTIPTPEQFLGFKVGTDFKLASYNQISEYFKILAHFSDRIQLENIGSTTEGKKLLLAIISSAENLEKINYYQSQQAQLADPRKIKTDIADSLIKNGKVVVSINCSIHSTEIGASQMSLELAHELAVSEDPLIKDILDNIILLLVPVHNPDGLNLVIDWYNRYLGTKYEGCKLPQLYHKYSGHDINRDWYVLSQP